MRPPRLLRLPRLLRTTSFRLTLLYLCVFAVSAAILGATVFLAARGALHQGQEARIDSETAFLIQEYHTGGTNQVLAAVQARGRGNTALDYLVQGPDGKSLAGEIPVLASPAPGWRTFEFREGDADRDKLTRVRALVTPLPEGLTLAVGDDVFWIGEVEEAITKAFVLAIGVAILLGVGGGIVLSRAFLARVDTIARTAEAIIGGDLERRIPLRGSGDDLDRLAATLNRMLDRIGILMGSLRQVSSDVAHDLRTPLSRLYQSLEDARSHARSVPEYERAVERAVSEAEGLLATFAALLRIAQVEGAPQRSGFRPLDLSAAMEAVADAYRPDAEEAGHHIHAKIVPGIRVLGDQELLTQAVANLVENALRHTPAGTRIGLHLRPRPSGVVSLVVEDDGPGVATTDLPRLTDRFYRAEQSRTTPGNGLGLTLVTAVAELHGSSLQLETTNPGLRATIHLFPLGA